MGLAIDFGNIPQEMTRDCYTQWVVWKGEKHALTGRLSKIPLTPQTMKSVKIIDPGCWSTYIQACQCYLEHQNQLKGIGFVFTKHDPFAGIDLDYCRDPKTGRIETWAMKIISEINSYTELSPSMMGVKIFLKGKVTTEIRTPEIEIYDSKRFFTVTGWRINEFSAHIVDNQPGLDSLCKEYSYDTSSISELDGTRYFDNLYDLESYLECYDISIFKTKPDNDLNNRIGVMYLLTKCPWENEHTIPSYAGESCLFLAEDGTIWFHCYHSHCAKRTWVDFHKKITGSDL